jgi:hypothetical protein
VQQPQSQLPDRKAKDPNPRQEYISKTYSAYTQNTDYAILVRRMTINQAYQDKNEVIMDECRQLLESWYIDGISPTAIPSEHRHSVVRAHMFLKDKTLANGCFDKRKARNERTRI